MAGNGGWQAVCFDLDGCLVDSSAAMATAMNAALDDVGVPLQAEARLQAFIGPPLQIAFTQLLDTLGADASLVPMLVERYRKHYRIASRELNLLFAGIEPMLHELSRHARLAVVTTKNGEDAEHTVMGLQLSSYFQGGVHGPSADAPDEPKQVTLERALEEMGVDRAQRSRCAMVGDRAHDIEAGEALGLITVGVTWGTGSREELTHARADHVVDTPAELAALSA